MYFFYIKKNGALRKYLMSVFREIGCAKTYINPYFSWLFYAQKVVENPISWPRNREKLILLYFHALLLLIIVVFGALLLYFSFYFNSNYCRFEGKKKNFFWIGDVSLIWGWLMNNEKIIFSCIWNVLIEYSVFVDLKAVNE